MAENVNNMENKKIVSLSSNIEKIASKRMELFKGEGVAELVKQLVAEFLGTYLLVFAGTGAIILDFLTGSLTHLGVSLIFGLALMISFYTFSHISGAHVNPAITLSYFIQKHLTITQAIGYIISQILGALAASWTLYLLFGNSAYLGAPIANGTMQQTFILEFILTFFLVMVTLSGTDSSKTYSGMAMGATLFVATFIGGPLTGAALNPARVIGPAIIAQIPEIIGIYLATSLSAAVIASFISYYLNE